LAEIVWGSILGAPAEEGNWMEFFLCVVGMVMIFEGVPYFAFPAKMKLWILKVLEMPDENLRRLGFVLMMIGVGLVYLGKR
jgi:uncharacterized protein YjeT (DUF2065 family)